jgi:hypothetical protein
MRQRNVAAGSGLSTDLSNHDQVRATHSERQSTLPSFFMAKNVFKKGTKKLPNGQKPPIGQKFIQKNGFSITEKTNFL